MDMKMFLYGNVSECRMTATQSFIGGDDIGLSLESLGLRKGIEKL